METPKEKYVAPINACDACKAQGKDWDGSDPKCAFLTGRFSSDNWNCATVAMIRALAPTWWSDAKPDPNLYFIREDDQNNMLIQVWGIDGLQTGAIALWVSWYKSRGRTEAMWMLNEDDKPVTPTEADIIAIAEAYAHRKPAVQPQ
jgi:hypothetical protein